MQITKSILILLMLLSMPKAFFAQSNYLSSIFAKRYLNLAVGKVSSTSKTTYTTNPSSKHPSSTVWDNSISLGFGYSLDWLRPNLFFEYNLNNNKYWNYTTHTTRHSNRINHPYNMIFHWVNEFGLKQHFSVYSNKLYISPFAGINFTFSRASKPNSDFNYDGTDGNWFRYTSAKIKPGIYGGLALNYKLGKRILVFGQYKLQTQFANNINLGEIKYIAGNGIVSDEFKSKIAPYNQSISLGLSFSLENSAFYK